MKICWWTNYQTVNQSALIRALRRQGVDIVVCYFCHYDNYRKALGWSEAELGYGEYFARSVSSARRQIEDFDDRLQMVPSFFNLTSWRVLFWSVLHRRPWFAVTEASRGSWLTAPLQWFFSKLANRYATRIFCIGAKAILQYSKYGVNANLLKYFAYATEVACGEASRGDSSGALFVYSGALTSRKAVDLLANAFKSLLEKMPNARLRIIGDGPMHSVFEGIKNVEMIGACPPDEISSQLADGDVIILPSRYDAWGVALVEGAAMGLAMIASDRVGASELVEQGKNGFIFKAGDVNALTDCMMKYADNISLAHQHGAEAKLAAQIANPDRLAALLIDGLADSYSGAFDTLSADGIGELPIFEKAVEPLCGLVVSDFWEEHCTECGAPKCYKSCAHFSLSPNGRCKRFLHGIRRAQNKVGQSAWEIEFLPWGKLELFFHGRVAAKRNADAIIKWAQKRGAIARFMERFASSLLPYGRTPCGLFRSLRWRYARSHSRIKGAPNLWVIDCSAEEETSLLCEVRDADERLLFAQTLSVPAAPKALYAKMALPFVRDGALFRIFPSNGEGTKKVWFRRNTLIRSLDSASIVKCVAWDLDGVLWDGTLAEDGLEGLKLNNEVVDIIHALDERGIVSSICSKNDEELALKALRHFGLEELFVFPQISWGAKSEALRRLASEMNISTNALAFVDDRIENRREVREHLPMVRVFNDSQISKLLSLPYFQPKGVVSGGSRRISYREEMVRRKAAKSFGDDIAAFLEDAQIELSYFDLASASSGDFRRCCELIGRANQLTMTGHRYGEAECRSLLSASNTYGWGISCRDRYGDYGIVGVAIASQVDNEWRIVEFVMSCRVAGKGYEVKSLEWIRDTLGAKRLSLSIVDTGLNRPLQEAVAPFLKGQNEVK